MATPKSKWEHEAGTDKGRNRSPVGHGTLTRRAAVVDLEAVEKEGLRLLRCLRTAMRDLAILALSSEADGRGPVEALMAGACGHFCKPVPPKQLARALVRVALGEIVLCQRSQEMVVRALWGMGMTRAGTELTPRQNEIMSGLLRRRIDKEIADEMGIKKATVHCQRALKTGQEGADENRPL
jgi:DNA-binding NarL/FixJ family response regulator